VSRLRDVDLDALPENTSTLAVISSKRQELPRYVLEDILDCPVGSRFIICIAAEDNDDDRCHYYSETANPSRVGFKKPSMKNTGHNLLTALLTDMHRFPPVLMTGHGQDEAQGTMILHHERNNLSPPPPHVPNDQDAQNKSIQTPTNNTERPATPPPVDNALPLLSNHRNQTPRMDAITYLNRLGEACTTP
jgi:hypothetical protein